MKSILECSGHKLILPNIIDSKGVYVIDSDGNQYMDLESGVWCASLGHSNVKINNVIKKQIDSIMHSGFCYTSKVVEKAGKEILKITEMNKGKCLFLSSGSEAVEVIKQATQHISKHPKTLVLRGVELGAFGSLTNRKQGWYSFDWENCHECTDSVICNLHKESILKIPKDITEFIFEPGSCAGFVRFPPKALIQEIVKVVQNNGGKIVVNEVTTGVGRTGKWFGYLHYGIKPDMISIGKGIGNGYPVSVAVFSENVISKLSFFKYSQSHQNDPLGATVVNEVIKIIKDENLIEEAETKGLLLASKLKILEQNGIKIRGKGLMFAIEFENEDLADSTYKTLIKNGYIVCNRGTFLRIDPPLIITNDEINQFTDELIRIVKN